jgi:YD repeat-containing protein
MKIRTLLILTICSLLLFSACKKTGGSGGSSSSGGKLVRIQQGIDPNLYNDTVYLISYNASGKIATLIDSVNGDTLTTSYDANGNLTGINDFDIGLTPVFTYDANNLLTQVDYNLAGSNEEYTYSYTNGTLSRINYNSDLGMGGGLTLQGYFLVTFAAGNISEIKSYTPGGSLQVDLVLGYDAQANLFKSLSLFDVGGRLGSDDIFNQFTYFNTNLLTSVKQSGVTSTSNYTFNSSQEPTRIVTNDLIGGDVFTWQFSYK